MKKTLKVIQPIKKRTKNLKSKSVKTVNFWNELPKIANLKNKLMGLNEDDEIIYDRRAF